MNPYGCMALAKLLVGQHRLYMPRSAYAPQMTRDQRHEPKIDFRLSDTDPGASAPEARAEHEIGSMIDLFQTTLKELHNAAPIELLQSLRESLENIRQNNPNSARTAKACLLGLASDKSTLLHVLTAAYLVNGGVMLKQQPIEEEESAGESSFADLEFKELEDELSRIAGGTPP